MKSRFLGNPDRESTPARISTDGGVPVDAAVRAAPAAERGRDSRLIFIDLMRGLVMLIMIEVHVVNSMMSASLRENHLFNVLNFINSLVAPSFIFISGFAFYLSSRVRIDEFRRFRWEFWRQLGRIGLIWMIGYQLHLPYFSLRNIFIYSDRNQLLHFYGIDVLQCIAFCLLCVFVLRLILRSEKTFLIVVGALGVFFVAGAAPAYRIDFTAFLPVPVAVYLNVAHYSLFPIFPWFGFMSAGVVFAGMFTRAHEQGRELQVVSKAFRAGMALALPAAAVIVLCTTVFPVFDDLRPNPLFFTARLGCVLAILALCHSYCRERSSLFPPIMYASRESLIVYWLHLQRIHRQLWNSTSLEHAAAGSFSFLQCMGVTLALIAITFPAAWAWNYLKGTHEYTGRAVTWAVLSLALIAFLIS
jgi:uncharacterized membrane protein